MMDPYVAAVLGILILAILAYNIVDRLSEKEEVDEVDVIDNELRRLHSQVTNFSQTPDWIKAEIARLNQSLQTIRLERDKHFFELEKHELSLEHGQSR